MCYTSYVHIEHEQDWTASCFLQTSVVGICNTRGSTTMRRAAGSQATGNEDLLKHNSSRQRSKEKKLLTLRRRQVYRNLQRDALGSTANPSMRSGKWWILAPALVVTQVTPELSWVGPAFLLGAQSLLQALT